MPRPVQIRASYRDDAAFLLRLEEAISRDTRQSEAWRTEAMRQARSLSVMLLKAETPEQKKNGKSKVAAR